MSHGGAIVRVRDLAHRYANGGYALNDVSFDVAPGEVVAIIGPSGAGKSTLLRCLNRLIEPTSGTVVISGQDVRAASRRELYRIRRSIGVVFQQLNLIARSTVLDNALAGRLGYISRWRSLLAPVGLTYTRVDRQIAFNNLRRVNLDAFTWERAARLSGGQQQRVAIARVLTQAPDVILADEPVANLDPRLAHEILSIFEASARARHIATIISIHSLELARAHSHRVIALAEGRVRYDGRWQDLSRAALAEIYGADVETVGFAERARSVAHAGL
jgi:phosphonate transport system ATP-binding protein